MGEKKVRSFEGNNIKLLLLPLAENYIRIVKHKLYRQLRGILSQDWVKQLRNVTESLNKTPIHRLGYLRPIDITSEESSVLVEEAKKHHNIEIHREPNYLEQINNLKNYHGELKVGDYVYKDFDASLFDKSFDVSVNLYIKENLLIWPTQPIQTNFHMLYFDERLMGMIGSQFLVMNLNCKDLLKD